MEKEVLIKIELPNVEDADKKIDSLTSSITELNDKNKELQKTNETLAKSGEKNSQQYLDNAKQIEVNKQKIQENTASRKGLIQVQVAEENSIKALRVQNTELIKQRDLINRKTDEGRKSIAAINAQIDANTKEIAANSSAMEKQKMNIGNYASALDGVLPGIGSFSTGITNLLNPVTALSTAVGTLATAYFSTGRGAQDLEKIQFTLSATSEVLSNRLADVVDKFKDGDSALGKFGRALVDTNPLIQGFRLQWNLFFGSTNDQIDSLAKLKGELDDLNQQQDIARTRQNNLLEDNSELLEEINRSSVSYNDKVFLAGKAIDNIREGEEAVLSIKRRELELLEQQLEINKDSEVLQRAIAAKALEISQEERRAEKLVNNILKLKDNLKDAEGKRLEILAKENKKLEDQQKIEERIARTKLLVFEETDLNPEDAIKAKSEEMDMEIRNQLLIEGTSIKTQQLTKYIQDKNKATEDGIKISNAAARSEKDRTTALLVLSSAMGGLAAAFREGTIANKIFSSAQAAINSFLAGTQVLRDEKLPTLAKIPAMIAIIASGLAQQVRILKTPVSAAAGGGNFLTKGPTMLLVGDNPGGVERVTVEPISGRGKTVVHPDSNLIAMAGGGSLTAMGETRFAASQASGQFDLNRLAGLMNSVKIVQVVQDFEAAQMAKNAPMVQAQVIG
jgi:hypothetical protein